MNLVPSTSKVLRTPTQKVTVKQGRETGRAMLKFLAHHNKLYRYRRGIGLAAPQVGLGFSVCVFSSFSAYPAGLVLVNPVIIDKCEITLDGEETCLSLPGEKYMVQRHIWVNVMADNLDSSVWFGPQPSENWSANTLLESRCVQHELAHLQGILISDVGRKV